MVVLLIKTGVDYVFRIHKNLHSAGIYKQCGVIYFLLIITIPEAD